MTSVSSSPAPPVESRRAGEWGVGHWLLAFLAAFFVSSAVSVAVGAFGPRPLPDESPPRVIVAGATVFPQTMVAGAILLFRRSTRSFREILGLDRPARDLVVDVGIGIAVGFGVQVALAVVFSLLDLQVEQEIGRELERIVGPQLAVLVVLVAVAAPVAEEMFFRVALLDALRRRVRVAGAVVIQGVVFGLVHLSPLAAVLALAGVGIAFGALIARGRSIVAVVVAHMTFNAFAVAALLTGVLRP